MPILVTITGPIATGKNTVANSLAELCISAGSAEPWVEHAKDWCWDQLSRPDQINGVLLKFALAFLDAHPDDPRTAPALDALRGGGGLAPTGVCPFPVAPRTRS